MKVNKNIKSPLLVVLLTMALLAGTGVVRADDLVVRAGVVYTVTGEPLRPGAVLISDGKIAQVARSVRAPEGARVIDLGSGTLIPGMINGFARMGVVGGAAEYTDEIDYLAGLGKPIDLAFLPISGCSLGTPESVREGVYYALEKLQPSVFFPQHAGNASYR